MDFLLPRLVRETIGLSEDSQGTITMAENDMSLEQTKNIEVRHHIIMKLVGRGVLSVQFTESSIQHADILTKTLRLESFFKHRALLMNLPERCGLAFLLNCRLL